MGRAKSDYSKKCVVFFKGTGSRYGYFFKGLHILRSFNSFSLPYTIISFWLLLWNYLLILKILHETLLRIPFPVIGRCSLLPISHWMQGKCARIILSQAAFGMILQNHRRLPVSIFSACQNRRFRVFEAG